MKRQFANLNIRYDFPIWDYRVNVIYSKTEGWIKNTQRWFSLSNDEKHVTAVLEPAGLAFNGLMATEEWNSWLTNLKTVATQILGYRIGEIELGEVGHDYDWVNNELSIFQHFSEICKAPNPELIGELLESPKPQLSELDEIEMEKWLFRANWHSYHDQLASNFQMRSHPSTASFLFKNIIGNNIPELEYKPITRKCVWALADIGTEEAKNYLLELSTSTDDLICEFAKKRLTNWQSELGRKGRSISTSARRPQNRIKVKPYQEVEAQLPSSGRIISAYQTLDSIFVYQAYKPQIAAYAVANQKFGGSDFSFNRMTWIKPNYLWMMYRCGWATKENQESVLAIEITKEGWEELLKEAVFSSFKPEFYESQEDWKRRLEKSEGRLQWDPNHDPHGQKLERKAIQIGIKGLLLQKFNSNMLLSISDITSFVKQQKIYVEHNQLQHLEIPNETVYVPMRKDLEIGISE